MTLSDLHSQGARSNRSSLILIGFVSMMAASFTTACGKGGAEGGPGAGGYPPSGVEVVTLEAKPVEETSEFVASLKSRRSSTIQPQVEGFITKINVRSGDRVNQGATLFEVDPGRGADQSYCVLMTGDKLGNDSRTRISTMVRTNDGFEISEVDLRLRGPGDLMGTQQSGIPELHIADLIQDVEILQTARAFAQRVLDEDPDLRAPHHAKVAAELAERTKGKPVWGRIS